MAIGDQHAWGEIHPPQIAADSHAGQSSTVALSADSAKHQAPSLAGLSAGLLVLATLGGMVAGALLMLVGRHLLPEALRCLGLERWVEGGL